MSLPDIKECFRLMDRYEMLPNIRNHSIIVARIAEQIIDDLLLSGIETTQLPDRDLVISGALLHDIAKTPCIVDGCNHAVLGAEICEQHGYPEIAWIIAEHVILSSHDIERHRCGHFDAREIVYYADKRVRHEDIVTLEVRLEYIIETYGKNDPQLHHLIRENFAKCIRLEKHLFGQLSFAPEELPDRVFNCSSGDITAAMQRL